MGSPFPGMDPYLEEPILWPGFQIAMTVCIQETSQPLLPASCYASIQHRCEISLPAPAARQIKGPAQDKVRHAFVEIRDASQEHRLVTLIEIVSPSNKAPGPDRKSYLDKQGEILDSTANLVEIDLLRLGRRVIVHPMLLDHLVDRKLHYVVTVNRAATRVGSRLDYEVYGFTVRDPLPNVAIPLGGGDDDVVLALRVPFERVYDSRPYSKIVNYRADPPQPLEGDDAAWADQLLRSKGRR